MSPLLLFAVTGLAALVAAAPAHAQEPITSGEGYWFDEKGQLHIRSDQKDPYGTINLYNNTTGKVNSNGTSYFRPGINLFADHGDGRGQVWHWSAPSLDVGDGVAGTAADLVLAMRRDPVTPTDTQDVIYLVDEYNPRIGVLMNVPRGDFHIAHRTNLNRDASLILDNQTGGQPSWLQRFDNSGEMRGGFYINPQAASKADRFARLRLGGTRVPTEMLDVSGKIRTDFLKLTSGAGAFQRSDEPLLYSTIAPGGGAYPFDGNGHLVIQPRAESGGAGRDVILGVGTNTVNPGFVLAGPSSTGGAPNIGLLGMLPSQMGGARGVVGLKTVSSTPTSNPAGGGLIWQGADGTFNHVSPSGDRTQTGDVGPEGQPGVAVNTGRGEGDAKFWRTGSGAWASNRDMEFEAGDGPVVRSPNGKKWRLTVSNSGQVNTTEVP